MKILPAVFHKSDLVFDTKRSNDMSAEAKHPLPRYISDKNKRTSPATWPLVSWSYRLYRCDDGKKLASQEAILVSLDRSWLPLSENANFRPSPKKNELFSQDMHSKLPTLDRVETCQFLKHDVEPRVFTFMWNRYHQWLVDTELIQISAFFQLLIPRWTCVSLLESEAGLGLDNQLADTQNWLSSHL